MSKTIPNENYDFSEEKSEDYYKGLSGMEKFMAYYADGWKKLEPDAQDCAKETSDNCGKVIDPDSNSEELQGIYQKMWGDNEALEKCSEITGDTLNSAWTTLNKLFGEFGYYRKLFGDYENNMSRVKILSQYYAGNGEQKEKFAFLEERNEFLDFAKAYHTLGNFMPVPVGCNQPRGRSSVQDYWDLTLLNIWKYYSEGQKQYIEKNVGASMLEKYREWLDAFGTWEEFINKNYLEAFVNDNGEPKELWDGHFEQYVKGGTALPTSEEQCWDYFGNAAKRINERSKAMYKIYKNLQSRQF